MTREDPLKCVNPKCVRRQEYRGNCGTCYATLLKAVREHKTTWKQLEAAGMALPPKREASPAKEWLDDFLKKKRK